MTRDYGFDAEAKAHETRDADQALSGAIEAWKVGNERREQTIRDADPKIREILAQYGPADGFIGEVSSHGPITASPLHKIDGLAPEVTGAEWSIVTGLRTAVKVSLYFDRPPRDAQTDVIEKMSQVPTILVTWHKEANPSKSNAELLLITLEAETGYTTR